MGRKKKNNGDSHKTSDSQEDDNWDLVFVAQYLRLFQAKYEFQSISANGLQQALLLSDSSIIIDAIVKLLGSILARDRETIQLSWQSDLSKLLDRRSRQGDSMKEKRFDQLDANERLSMLKQLIWLNIEAKEEDLRQFAEDKANGVARVQPIGQDSLDNNYWYLGGCKLYKRSVSKRSRNKWEVTCASVNDWKLASKKFSKSSCEKERLLCQAMNNLIPKVSEILEQHEASVSSKQNRSKVSQQHKNSQALAKSKEQSNEVSEELTNEDQVIKEESELFESNGGARRKRQCVIQKQKPKKMWWDDLSDSDRVSASSEGTSASESDRKKKQKRRKRRSLDLLKQDTERVYMFTTSIANSAAEAVNQGLFESVIEYHRVKLGPKTSITNAEVTQTSAITTQPSQNNYNHSHDRASSLVRSSYNPNSTGYNKIIDEYPWHQYHPTQQQQNSVHTQQQAPMVMHGSVEEVMLGYGMYPHQSSNPNDLYQRSSYQPVSVYQPQIGDWSHQNQFTSQNTTMPKMLQGVNYPGSQQRISQMMPPQQQTQHYMSSNEQSGHLSGLLYSSHSPLHRTTSEQLMPSDPVKPVGVPSVDNGTVSSQATNAIHDGANVMPTTTETQYYSSQNLGQQPVGSRLSQGQQWQSYPMYMPQEQWQHYQHVPISSMPNMPSTGFDYSANASQFSSNTPSNEPSVPQTGNPSSNSNKFSQGIDKDRQRSAQSFSVEGFLSTKDAGYQSSNRIGQGQITPTAFHSQSTTATASTTYPYSLQYQSTGYGSNQNFYQHLSKDTTGGFTNATSALHNNYSSVPEVALPKDNNPL